MFTVLSILFFLGIGSSVACKCVPPTLASSFQDSSIVIKATVTGNKAPANGNRFYDARVLTVYKGCNVKPNQKVVLSTKASTATCGVFLSLTTTYVLMGDVDRVVQVSSTNGTTQQLVYISINRCRFRSRFNALNAFQIDHLKRLQAKVPPCGGPIKCNATSCSCSKPSFDSSFSSSSLVIKATITGNRYSSYDATVVTVYKGCNLGPNRKIVLSTKLSDPCCGVPLSVNTTYLLMGDIDSIVEVAPDGGAHPGFEVIAFVSINKCQFQARFSSLNSYQLDSLKRFAKVPPCGPWACNAAKSCAIAPIPYVPDCPGQNSTLDRLKCTYLNSTRECDYLVLPCPAPPGPKCNFTSCGPPLMLAPCQFGNGPGLSCDYNQATKRCAWNVTPCTFPCLSNSDCNPNSQYCSNGVCRSFGKCGNIIDCINPNNKYFVKECVGYLQCTNGACGKTCGPSVCPPNAPFQNTCAGCAAGATTTAACLNGTTCVDYKCGECKSFCF